MNATQPTPFVPDHLTWCDFNFGADCNCRDVQNFLTNLDGDNADGSWRPNRNPTTEVGAGWSTFVERCKLSFWPETERVMLRGRDGWAFGTAIRFQHAACDLAKVDEQRFWSSYYLLWCIIERARVDMEFLEAMEALAVAHLYGGLSVSDVTKQLRSLEVWP